MTITKSTQLALAGMACCISGCSDDGPAQQIGSTEMRAANGGTPVPYYAAIAESAIPDPCDYLTQQKAEAGLSHAAMGHMEADEGIDPMSCDYTASEPRTSFEQKIRNFTLTAVEWPRDRFNSEGLNGTELREAIRAVANYKTIDPIGEWGFGPTFIAHANGSSHMIIVPKVRILREGAQYPGGEIVILASLDNAEMRIEQRLAALRGAANDFAKELHQRALQS